MPETLPPQVLRREVLVVFAVSLGAEGLRALVELLGDLTSGLPLGSLHPSLIVSQAPGRPWLDPDNWPSDSSVQEPARAIYERVGAA